MSSSDLDYAAEIKKCRELSFRLFDGLRNDEFTVKEAAEDIRTAGKKIRRLRRKLKEK